MRMYKKHNRNVFNSRKKNIIKVSRTVVQIAILLILSMLLIETVFNIKKYKEPDKTQWTNRDGFIALSYFGVGRLGTPKLIAKSQLDRHLRALYDLGYITVTQQDILDFYQRGMPLPEKALFLTFEDGRNDSALFAQPILEKFDYKATILSYAGNLEARNSKFLGPRDMLKLMRSGFWELGTNGYRLTYINIFDKDNNFIGMKNEIDFKDKETAKYYNHYLMDFILDKDMVPVENRKEMEVRIDWDYQRMKEIYTQKLGFMPGMYMIMHANSLYYNMNRLVEGVNDKNIKQNFKMHFNREGFCYNDLTEDLYNLTRLQPAPYWYTNHLLMKIKKDTGQEIEFVVGDEQRAKEWELLDGAVEFTGNRIVLTSCPADRGLLYLKNSGSYKNIRLNTKISGNVVGKQAIYIRYNREKDSFVKITIADNQINVEQKPPDGKVHSMFSYPLNDIQLDDEDTLLENSSAAYIKIGAPYRDQSLQGEHTINIRKTREIEIAIEDNRLQIIVDKEPLADGLVIDGAIAEGGIALESKYSERNKKDDVYDAVFDDIKILEIINKENGKPQVVFYNGYNGFQKVIRQIKHFISSLFDWAIELF